MAIDNTYLDTQPRDGELAAIERQVFERPWSAADYAQLRANPLVSAWILRGRGGAPHGSVCFQLVAGEVEIFRIGVLPQHRRAGKGRAMLESVLEHVAAQDTIKVFLEVRAGNNAARRMYHSLGFRQVGTREGYFQNPREDALIFGLSSIRESQGG